MALQKNPGPLLTSWFKGLVDHIPPEWRARLGLKKNDQENPVDVDPDAIVDVLVNSEVNQTRTDERKKSDVRLATDPTGVELHQQKRLANGQLVDEVRTFVPEGTPLAGVGVETIEAEQHNLGIGWMTNDVTDASLPGPSIESSEIDKDGEIIQIVKTRRLRSTITEGETLVAGIWTKITIEGETDLVATEVVKSRTIPGNPMDTTRVDEDSMVVTIVTTFKEESTVVEGETVVGGVWSKTRIADCTSEMGGSDIVVDEVVESRALPGNPMVTSKIDKDGIAIEIVKTLRHTSTFVAEENITTGQWFKREREAVSDLVAWEVVQLRPVPGNAMDVSRIDEDGKSVLIRTIFKDKSTVVTGETLVGVVWTKIRAGDVTSTMGVSDLVVDEISEFRGIPGNSTANTRVDGDQEIQFIATTFRDESLITSASAESGGFINTVEKKSVPGSLIIAEEVATSTHWLDKAIYAQSIPDSIIPLEFRAQIPTVVESHVVAGIASMPTLTGSQISVEQRQLTKNLKEVRSTSFGEDITFPIDQIGSELTEEYGGGILEVTRRLHNVLIPLDFGEDVVRSRVQPIGEDLMWFRETARRYGAVEWPELVGTEVDPRTGIVVEVKRQVVDAGTLGGVGVDGYTDAKPIDVWRTLTISSKLQLDSLPDVRTWETTIEHSFPNTLNGLLWLWAEVSGTLTYDFDSALILDMTQGYAGPCRALVTESFSDGPPSDVVAITQFFPQGHMVGYSWWFGASTSSECDSCTDQVRAQAKTWTIPPALHGALTIGGGVSIGSGGITGTLPATTPTGLPASDTLITKAVEVEPWRFNIFYRKMVQIYVP